MRKQTLTGVVLIAGSAGLLFWLWPDSPAVRIYIALLCIVAALAGVALLLGDYFDRRERARNARIANRAALDSELDDW